MDPLRRARVALCTTPGDRLVVHYCASPVMVPTAGQQTSGSTAQSLGAFSVGPVVSAVAGVPVGRWGPPRSGGSTVFSAPVTAVIALAPGDALLADLFGFPTAYTALADPARIGTGRRGLGAHRGAARVVRTEGPGRGSRCKSGTDPQP